MRGLHLTADLYECRCEQRWLSDGAALGAWLGEAASAAGLDVLQQLTEPAGDRGGISAAMLLPYSHVCVHTWPAQRGVAIDVYLASDAGDPSAKAHGLMTAFVNHFAPQWTEQRSLDRGGDDT
jgi:S-adenosylmethionine decarboxylase